MGMSTSADANGILGGRKSKSVCVSTGASMDVGVSVDVVAILRASSEAAANTNNCDNRI